MKINAALPELFFLETDFESGEILPWMNGTFLSNFDMFILLVVVINIKTIRTTQQVLLPE